MRAQRSRLLGALAVLVLVAPVAGVTAAPAPIELPHVPNVVLVGFAPGATASERAAARARVGATARPISPLAKDAEHWALPRGLSTEAAMAALENVRALRYVEPDWIVTATDTSDDPYYVDGTLWGMHGNGISPANQYGTGADEAWARGYIGSRDVYVGIIDTGVQWAHPDLVDNFWTNAIEATGATGVDDDGNGRIDDLHGFDFVRYDGTVFDADEHYHGTHVAGTIGGVGGNGIGVAGVNWRVRMISGKFLDSGGSGAISNAAAAADYLTDLKIRKGINLVATSNSWGGGGFSQTMLDAINRGGDQGILFIAAAGNGYADNDATANYPSNYQCTTRKDTGQPRGWDCMVAVAAIDVTGAKAGFSNWGITTVDLGAPGVNVRSTYPPDTYNYLSGTSMATPHVSGAAALCESINPSLTPSGLRQALLNSTTPTASLAGLTVTGGRLDVGNLVDVCLPPTAPVDGSVSNLAVGATSTKTVDVTWTSSSTNESGFEIQTAIGTLGACGSFSTVATAGANTTAATIGGLTAATDYCVRVRAVNGYSGGTSTAWSNTASGRTASPPPAYVCSASTFAWVDPTGATPIAMSDDSTTVVNLPSGFGFTSYGTTSTQVMISSNGFLRLGSNTGSYYTNGPIPSTAEPNGVIAPAWDDWNPSLGGGVSYQTVGSSPNRQFVVTWRDLPHYNVAGSTVSFQAILYEASDVIDFQYLDMLTGNTTYDSGGNATAGVENATGEYGTQIGYNQKVLLDGTARRCTAGVSSTPSVATQTLPNGGLGVGYSATLSVNGGVGPYSWSVTAGALPAGLSLASSGAITGTPTTSATTGTFTATVTDGGTKTASRTLAITIGVSPTITSTSLPNASANSPYSAALAATGGSTPYAWTLASGAIPTGMTLDANSGLLSGTPTQAGSYSFRARVVGADSGAAAVDLVLVVGTPPTIATSSLPGGSVDESYGATLTASGGTGPYTWSVASGSLPTGLSLSTDGTIAGTPTVATTASFTVRATGTDGGTSTRALSIAVAAPPSITTSSLASGTAGAAYSVTLAATGGTTPYTWSATGLPSGISVSAGRLSGTPTQSGTFSVVLSVSDGGGRRADRTLSLVVAFGKASPANSTKFVNTTTSVPLSWYPDSEATSYRWCAGSSTKACSNWTTTSATTASVTVTRGQTWNWQVQALIGGTWTGANGGSGWKFSINR